MTQFLSTDGRGRVRELSLSGLESVRTFELAEDVGPDTEASGRGVPNYVAGVALSPDGLLGLVPSKKDNVARGVFREGQPLTFESTVRTIVSRLDLVANEESLSARLDLDDRSLAQSVVFSPVGDVFFVASLGSNRIDVFATETRELVVSFGTGPGPLGMAIDSAEGRLWVHEFLARSVSAFDIEDLLSGRSNAVELVAIVPTVAAELLPPSVLNGKRLFYDASDPRLARDGYLGCATCHLDGRADGEVWDLTQSGEGLRNTIPLIGRAGTGHGLLHWTANFDEVQDFENQIRDLAGGTGLLSDSEFAQTEDPLGTPKANRSTDLDDLAEYVGSLAEFPPSPFRNQDGTPTAEALAGAAVFQALGCASCHAGPPYTDGLRHDVGTLKPSSGSGSGLPLAGVGIETPTLRGVWESAPYHHDGSAATLEEVLANPLHGATGGLSAAERSQLVAFLLQLE